MAYASTTTTLVVVGGLVAFFGSLATYIALLAGAVRAAAVLAVLLLGAWLALAAWALPRLRAERARRSGRRPGEA